MHEQNLENSKLVVMNISKRLRPPPFQIQFILGITTIFVLGNTAGILGTNWLSWLGSAIGIVLTGLDCWHIFATPRNMSHRRFHRLFITYLRQVPSLSFLATHLRRSFVLIGYSI
jgi:hypothetical protein